MGKPRIADVDYLDPGAVEQGMHEGEWVRVNQYKDGHRVSVVGHSAWCGQGLIVDHEWWEGSYRPFLATLNADPGPWYIAIDRRAEASRCTKCKKADVWVVKEASRPVKVDSQPVEHVGPLGAAEKLAARRMDMVVSWVSKILDVEEVT